VQEKWALEEHLSTPENNELWDDSSEAARNGKQYMDYVESHLLDVDERIKIMDATGIERTILSLTSPGIQSITDTGLAVKAARDTNDLVKRNFVDRRPDRLSMFALRAAVRKDWTDKPFISYGKLLAHGRVVHDTATGLDTRTGPCS
jgi:gamma-resorcylate decarboxylase